MSKGLLEAKVRMAQSVAADIDVIDLANGLFQLAHAQSHISGLVPTAISDPPQNDQIAYAVFALQAELVELADELGWKKWKENPQMTEEQQAKIAEEFADVLAFLGQLIVLLCLRSGVPIRALADAYKAKSEKNVARFNGTSGEAGYNGTVKQA